MLSDLLFPVIFVLFMIMAVVIMMDLGFGDAFLMRWLIHHYQKKNLNFQQGYGIGYDCNDNEKYKASQVVYNNPKATKDEKRYAHGFKHGFNNRRQLDKELTTDKKTQDELDTSKTKLGMH